MANPQLRTLQKVFGGIAASLFAVALLVAAHTVYFMRSAVHAQGEVIELLHVESDDDGDGTWKPRVRFRTAAGETIDFESSTSSNPPSYEVGEAVRVLHAPGDPRNARIDSFFFAVGHVHRLRCHRHGLPGGRAGARRRRRRYAGAAHPARAPTPTVGQS